MSGHGVFSWLRSWRGSRTGRPRGGVRIRIELYEDDPGWVFRVPSLGIIGGAKTREEAVTRMIEAIEFTLESPHDKASGATQQLYVDAELHVPKTPVPA